MGNQEAFSPFKATNRLDNKASHYAITAYQKKNPPNSFFLEKNHFLGESNSQNFE